MRAADLIFLKKLSLLVVPLDSEALNELLRVFVTDFLTNGYLEEGAGDDFVVGKV